MDGDEGRTLAEESGEELRGCSWLRETWPPSSLGSHFKRPLAVATRANEPVKILVQSRLELETSRGHTLKM